MCGPGGCGWFQACARIQDHNLSRSRAAPPIPEASPAAVSVSASSSLALRVYPVSKMEWRGGEEAEEKKKKKR